MILMPVTVQQHKSVCCVCACVEWDQVVTHARHTLTHTDTHTHTHRSAARAQGNEGRA